MLPRSILVWLVILSVAFANGALRELWLIPRVGAGTGHVVSTLILSAAILLVSWRAIRWIRPASPREAWGIGIVWLGLTLTFELIAGHYLFGVPWNQLLADYNLSQGRIWVLVLVTTVSAPRLAARWRGITSTPRSR